MDVPDTAAAIRTMKVRGAGRIARAASSSLAEFAIGYEGGDREAFVNELRKCRETLLDSRPTAVSLYNGVSITLKGVMTMESVEEMRNAIVGNSRDFISASENAVKKIGETGSELICDGDVILTHCNSSAAVGVLRTAHAKGKKFRVFATESRPWGQGFITVTEISEAGIDVTLIIDSAVTMVMSQITKVFVGADTVASDGSLYNKIGTSQIALAAKRNKVPFYACAETYKFNPVYRDKGTVIEERDRSEVLGSHTIPDSVKVFNPVFDHTDADNITGIITEEGMIAPNRARSISIEHFGEKEERG